MSSPKFDIDTLDLARAEAPATRMELYLVARMLQNYILASKNEMLVFLARGIDFQQAARDRVEKLDRDLDVMLNELITAVPDDEAI